MTLSYISALTVDDFDISDHLPICCTLTLKERRRNEEVKNTQENQTNAWVKYKWNSDFKDAFLTKFRDNYRAFQNNFVNEEISLVDLLPEFINIFQKSAENMKYQRKKTTRKRQPDWWDAECDQAKRSKNLLLRLFRERNTRNYLEEYLYKRKQFKIIVKRKKINFKRRNKKNLIDSRNCPKKFWKNIKANKVKRNDTNMIEPSAWYWYQYFKKILCPQNNTEAVENGNNDLLAGIRQDNNSDDLNSLITDDEVKQSISRLHANKAPGPDVLPAEFFKCTSEFTSPYLCPPNRRWGTYCFWCGSRRRRRRRRRPRRRPRPRSFFLTRYLLNQWMDFDQTCIDTWLGGGKELIRFW